MSRAPLGPAMVQGARSQGRPPSSKGLKRLALPQLVQDATALQAVAQLTCPGRSEALGPATAWRQRSGSPATSRAGSPGGGSQACGSSCGGGSCARQGPGSGSDASSRSSSRSQPTAAAPARSRATPLPPLRGRLAAELPSDGTPRLGGRPRGHWREVLEGGLKAQENSAPLPSQWTRATAVLAEMDHLDGAAARGIDMAMIKHISSKELDALFEEQLRIYEVPPAIEDAACPERT